ncbi:MAG: CPBP family glutamic-type intramembrane protease, partial [Planctomycetia bacterium]|nr:CPBP family glutamic-type intramembrane protease [Planctomycetia bacterium]
MSRLILEMIPFQVLGVLAITVWSWIVFFSRRIRTGRFPPGFRDRRPTPWTGTPAGLLLISALLLPPLLTQIAIPHLTDNSRAVRSVDPARAETSKHSISDHPALNAMRDPEVAPVIFLGAVLVAPAFEETLFRLLLLGGLEASIFQRLRRRHRPLRCGYPIHATLAILFTGIIFALLHVRPAHMPDVRPGLSLETVQILIQILTIILILVILRCGFNADLNDCGLDPGPGGRFLVQDLRIGLIASAMFIVPLFLTQAMVGHLFRIYQCPIAPDPVAIFLLAIVLGTLFIRTRRLLPCIVLHF